MLSAVLLLGCAGPGGNVDERPAFPSFENAAFFNSLVHGPQPDLQEPEALGGSASVVESGKSTSK
jgi:hypothetical protein